jgi:hypothetical protein
MILNNFIYAGLMFIHLGIIGLLKFQKMKKSIYYIALLLGFAATFTACDDDVQIPNEEELITTLKYTLTPVGGGDAIEFSYTDLDGDGGTAPVIVGEILAASTTYTGVLTILNESVSPVENITEEIEAEDEEHQFFFTTTVSGAFITYSDTDGDGNPIGLATTLTTGAAGSGSLTITLRHEPIKSALNVAEGDITNAGGETDIEVSFPFTVL